MKTQIVYVVISSEEDFFLEELWVSIFSLRYYHPSERVVVLTDNETKQRIELHSELKRLITEIVTVEVPSEFNNRLKSRVIKTNLLKYIKGDFLFVDTDTVICGRLDGIDGLSVKNIAMVPELHGPFQNHITYKFVRKDTEKLFDIDLTDCRYWYNSGCMLVRDNPFTHQFFEDWFNTWKYAALEKGAWTDQRALLKTDYDHGYVIEHLPDEYNCQVALSIQYLYDAKILHFWHMRKAFMSKVEFSPFLSKEIYKLVRNNKGISSEAENIIRNPKKAFSTPSVIVGRAEQEMLMSPYYTFLWKAYKDSKVFEIVLNGLIKLSIWRTRIINKLCRKKQDLRW